MDPSPSSDELAAIGAAYLRLADRSDGAPPVAASRWRLAARLPAAPQLARYAAGVSRWKAAGRIDG